jgi:hypothetical protein
MSNDPAPNQDLPVDVDINVGTNEPNQDLPDEKQPPRGPDQNRGRDEEARRKAPGQQDKQQ